MTYQQGVFKRYHSGDKHFSEFYLQDGGKNHVIRTEWRSYRGHRLCDVTSLHPVYSRSVTDAVSHRATMSSCSRHFTSVHVLWTSVEIYVARVLILIRFSHDRSPTYSIERRFWLHAVQGPRRVFCRKLESRSIFNLSCRKWDALHVAAKETRPHTHARAHTYIHSCQLYLLNRSCFSAVAQVGPGHLIRELRRVLVIGR